MLRFTRVVALLLAAAALLTMLAVFRMPDGRLHVVFVDVESGQGVLVQSPAGRWLLIDGGARPSKMLEALGLHLPFWQRSLHAVITTHAGDSALSAQMEVFRRYRVVSAIAPLPGVRPGPLLSAWQSSLAERGVDPLPAAHGALLDLGSGVVIHIAPAGEHLSIRLSYGAVSLLLPGLSPVAGDADATVVALPASVRSRQPLTLTRRVEALVLLDGKQTPDAPGLPSIAGVAVLSTAVHGTIRLSTDGQTIRIEPVR